MSDIRFGDVDVAVLRAVLPSSYERAGLSQRIEREIADRRFGPGRDPIVTAIVDSIIEAVTKGEQ